VSVPAVVPAPASIAPLAGAPFALDDTVAISGDRDAATALRDLLALRAGLTLDTVDPHDPLAVAPDRIGRTRRTIALTVDPAVGGPESYRLEADATAITVVGADAAGLFYGIQTLGQLVTDTDTDTDTGTGTDTGTDTDPGTGTGTVWTVPPVRIVDSPRFAYRGMMLDVARHFHGVATVTACIDRAASLKLNVLHLHLTDDQGWRLEITSRPRLTELSSGSAVGGDPGGHYSQDDYRELVAYAAARHVTIVPEIDMPGHTHAVTLAHPELSEQPVLTDHIREVVRRFGGELPVNGADYDGFAVGFSSLRIRDEATYAFVRDVLAEVADLTPGPYLHVGGDEALGTAPEDFAFFLERVTGMVVDLGKTPVTWHEAGAVAGLAAGTVGQYWGFVAPIDGADDDARAFVRRGGKVVLSPADATYLDMKFDADSPLGLTWARGVTSAQRAYDWEPSAVVAGLADDEILGVEAPLWSETVRDLADIDALAFPRIAAAAEAAWSPATSGSPLRTWESFRERVGALGPLWTALGIGFTPLAEFDWSDA